MQKDRVLGRSGIRIAPIVLGGNVFGWTADAETSLRVLDAFVDRGFNAIDTADVYSTWVAGHQGGESESLLGRWLQDSGKRNAVVLATKVGLPMGDGSGGLRRKHILHSVEQSLRRLRTEVIDLYQSHRDDPDTPLEETLSAYNQLLQEGKVRAIGASNYTGKRLLEAASVADTHALFPYTTVQPEYNLYAREAYETELAPVVERLQMGVIPYYALAAGFLTGKYKTVEDTRGASRGSRVERYFDERGMRLLQALAKVSAETGVSQASVALAWLLAQPTVTAPIASATSVEQLHAFTEAAELTLSAAQLDALTLASAYATPAPSASRA